MLRTREAPQTETSGARRRERLWTGLTIYLAVLLLVLGGVGWWLWSERQKKLDAGLLEALQRSDRAAMYRLIQSGASPDVSHQWGMTAFTFAVNDGDLALIELLFHRGVTPETYTDHSMTAPITLAALSGQTQVVELLLARGVSPTRRDIRGDLPLPSAAWGGHRDTVELLLTRGASPTTADASGLTPLHGAAMSGDAKLVQLFLARGADPNAVVKLFSTTPLMLAAQQGHSRAARLLLKAGADPKLKNSGGKIAADLAAKKKHFALARLLRARSRP